MALKEEINRLMVEAQAFVAAAGKVPEAVAKLRLVFQENPNNVSAVEYGAISKAFASVLDAREKLDVALADFHAVLTDETPITVEVLEP